MEFSGGVDGDDKALFRSVQISAAIAKKGHLIRT
jgi:hypothetical protein